MINLKLNASEASCRIKPVVTSTPLFYHKRLSQEYDCRIYIKREDMQPVRSYKIRGAFNKIASLNPELLKKGVCCASAGNHAQGVAYSCNYLDVPATIFMPLNTPAQKIKKVKEFSNQISTVILAGQDYDESEKEALKHCTKFGMTFIHPFNDEKVIEGQATVALEILNELQNIEYLFVPVGGGGLASGVSFFIKKHSPETKVIGVEPKGAASMLASFKAGKVFKLESIYSVIDGASVKTVGELTYSICKEYLDDIVTVEDGRVCTELLTLYNEDGIICELAGALSISALGAYADFIKGKTVVCVLSGANNDSNRISQIKELAEEWQDIHRCFIMHFQHNPDELSYFFKVVLDNEAYITSIEYVRNEYEYSTYSFICIKSTNRLAYQGLIKRLSESGISYKEVLKGDSKYKMFSNVVKDPF
jgi:threonine dehydratase